MAVLIYFCDFQTVSLPSFRVSHRVVFHTKHNVGVGGNEGLGSLSGGQTPWRSRLHVGHVCGAGPQLSGVMVVVIVQLDVLFPSPGSRSVTLSSRSV